MTPSHWLDELYKSQSISDSSQGYDHCRFSMQSGIIRKKVKKISQSFLIESFPVGSIASCEYVTKGREIVVNGRVSAEDYKCQDAPVVKYVVILNGFHLCGSKLDKEATPASPGEAGGQCQTKKNKKEAV